MSIRGEGTADAFPRAWKVQYSTTHYNYTPVLGYVPFPCGHTKLGVDSNTKCHFRDAGSIRFFTVYGVTRAAVHVNIKGKDLKQLLVTYTCDAEQISMSSLLKFLIPSANSSRTVERRENVRLGCELRVD